MKPSSEALLAYYQTHATMFVAFRMFANCYREAPREVYLEAVAQAVKGFEDSAKMLVQVQCNQMQVNVKPGVENVAVKRYRQDHLEAIANVSEYVKAYLISLNQTPPPAEQQEKKNAG